MSGLNDKAIPPTLVYRPGSELWISQSVIDRDEYFNRDRAGIGIILIGTGIGRDGILTGTGIGRD